jgi:AhpD family alkylhydroperoxidase
MQNATNIENALPQSKARTTLDAVRERVGFVPNLFAMLAEQPGVVEAFVALDTALTNTSLSPIERQVVQLTASVENRGHYCVAGHSIFGRSIGMPAQAIEAIRSGTKVDDERLSALHAFVVQLVRARGHVRPKYADSAMRLKLDKQFEPAAWSGTDADRQ